MCVPLTVVLLLLWLCVFAVTVLLLRELLHASLLCR